MNVFLKSLWYAVSGSWPFALLMLAAIAGAVVFGRKKQPVMMAACITAAVVLGGILAMTAWLFYGVAG